MIKTKRFFALVLMAVACFLFVGCGEEPVKELPAPNELSIEADYVELGTNGIKLGGDDLELSVVVDEGHDDTVTWTSSNEAVATVDEKGNVTGVAYGRAIITATAKNGLNAEFPVVVYGTSANDMLQAAAQYVKDAMPSYIQGGVDENEKPIKTKLPCDYLTEFFEYSYISLTDREAVFTNNRYYTSDAWNDAKVDTLDSIQCTIKFKQGLAYSGSRDAIVQIHVVMDLEENDFKAVNIYNEGFDAFFAKLPVDAYNIAELALAIPQSSLLTVKWESTNTSVISVGKNDDEQMVIRYTKPLDDTVVKLTATVISKSGQGSTKSIELNAKGYSKDDKIEYFRSVICADVLALVGQRVSRDIKLPTIDQQFEMQIEWASSDAEYLDATGKYTDHKEEDENTPRVVTLTATLTYLAFDEYGLDPASFTSPNSFQENVEFVMNVYPCTQSGRAINQILAQNARLGDQEEDGSFLGYFPYGRLSRANEHLVVPATMEEAGYTGEVDHPEWKNAAITWTVSEEGLFDENYNLLKQYLRYHSVTFTGTVTLGEVTEVFEVVLNVGLAKAENTIHIGGSFSRLAVQESELTAIAMDSLATLSGFDDIVGKLQDYYKGNVVKEYYTQCMMASEDLTHAIHYVPESDAHNVTPVTVEMSYALDFTGGFGGVTLSWVNEETGNAYTYFANESFTWIITDDDVNEDGTLKTVWMKQQTNPTTQKSEWVECSQAEAQYQIVKSLGGRLNKQYDGMIVINASSKIVKFPVIFYGGANDDLYPKDKEHRIGYSSGFEAGAVLAVYGGKASTIITNGVVGFSAMEDQNKFNDLLLTDLEDGLTDPTTGMVEYIKYEIMEPGAIIVDTCEGMDLTFKNTKDTELSHETKDFTKTGLCTAGTKIEIAYWKIHACNTVSTTDRYVNEKGGTFGANINKWVEVLSASQFADLVNAGRLGE